MKSSCKGSRPRRRVYSPSSYGSIRSTQDYWSVNEIKRLTTVSKVLKNTMRTVKKSRKYLLQKNGIIFKVLFFVVTFHLSVLMRTLVSAELELIPNCKNTSDSLVENLSISRRKSKKSDDKRIESDSPIWTRISNSIYTYSAFLDLRSIKNQSIQQHDVPIRIIGLWKLRSKKRNFREESFNPEEYTCKVFYVSGDTQELIQINGLRLTREIFDKYLKIYVGTFFNCYVNNTFAKILEKSIDEVNVGIYPSGIENYPDKLSPVSIIPDLKLKNSSKNSSFGACIRPLFGPMDDIVQLNQFLSFYTTMGITEFNFYDFGLSPRVRKYLNEKITSGIFIRKWNLPTGNWNELWDYGALVALNDCLYRNMDKNWLIVVDIDEFMVPQNGNENTTLISLLENSNYKNYNHLVARNTFFCKEFSNFSIKLGQFPIFLCTNRTKRIWNIYRRSKYILQPLKIYQLGHHKIGKFLDHSIPKENQKNPGPQTYIFPEQILILNHYRECKSISTKKYPILDQSIKIVLDNSILKFMTKVMENKF